MTELIFTGSLLNGARAVESVFRLCQGVFGVCKLAEPDVSFKQRKVTPQIPAVAGLLCRSGGVCIEIGLGIRIIDALCQSEAQSDQILDIFEARTPLCQIRGGFNWNWWKS